jgi:DNA-binding transcriptional MerR regulator
VKHGRGQNIQRRQRAAVVALERGNRILELRKQGISFRGIEEILKREAMERGGPTRGLSYERIRQHYLQVMALRAAELADAAEEHKALLAARLEGVIASFWPYLSGMDDCGNGPEAVQDEQIIELKKKAGDVVIRAVRELADILGVRQLPPASGQGGVKIYFGIDPEQR